MKYRYLSIFLILLILSIGAVSAQDDAAADDNIAIVQDEEVLSASEFVIDDTNYDNYFDESGLILENSGISDGDTLKLGNISDKDFKINKHLTVTSNSSSDVLTNVSLVFIYGSDNSEICNLNFAGDGIDKSSIYLQNSENIQIHDNVINIVGLEGSHNFYAIYAWASHNLAVQANVITYDGKSDGQSHTNAIYVSQSNDVVISDNQIYAKLVSVPILWVESPPSSFNYLPDTFSEVIKFDDCKALELSTNSIEVRYSNFTGQNDSIYTVELFGCDDAVIEDNIIYGSGHSYIYGLVIRGKDFTVSGNDIIMASDENYVSGIEIDDDSTGIVNQNHILVFSPYVAYGIRAQVNWGVYQYPDVDYLDNYIVADSHAVYAMNIYGADSIISGSTITATGNYTMGIFFKMMDDAAVITNNEITVKGLKNDTEAVGDRIQAQTVGILAMSDSEIKDNVITSSGNYTVITSADEGEITDNYLYASELLGDDSVDDKSGVTVVENNIPIEDARNYNVTNDTFFRFFTKFGKLREGITPETLTFIGEFSGKSAWNQIDRPITLISDNATLHDMSFKITSDGVVFDGFTFIFDALSPEIISIYGVDDVSVINCVFDIAGADNDNNYVIRIIDSENVFIANNTIDCSIITTYMPYETYNNWVVSAEGSEKLIFISNEINAQLPSRTMDWTTGAVYSEAVHINDCDGVLLSGNTINVTSNNQIGSYATLYAVEIHGGEVQVIENVINLVDAQYGYALVMSGEDFVIDNNKFSVGRNESYACGIDIESNSNGSIENNLIRVEGDSIYGIYTANWAGDVKANITNNTILATGITAFAMSLSGSEATVDNNKIYMYGNFTTGIASKFDMIFITNNTIIDNASDEGTPAGYDSMGIETTGIHIVGGNATVTNNDIKTNGKFAVDAKGTGSVTDNSLFAKEYTGDAAVDYNPANTIVANNTPTMIRAVINAEDIVMYYKNGTRYIVILSDQFGNPIANMNVTLIINGESYTRTTDSNGAASLAINLNSGNYTASASFIGVDPYTDTSVENNITILSTVYGDDIVKVFKNGTQYYATFLDGQGNPLANGTEVTFNINGVMYKRYVRGTEGKAKLNINLEQGEYIVTAINSVNGEMHANNITVLSSITDNHDLVKYYKNASQYVVTIIGDDGNPVGAGANVTFNVNGLFYTRQTNESGQAKLNINLAPGDYIITTDYKGCKVSNNIKVLPVLSAGDLVKKYGTPDQFVATLVDGQGNPYPGQNVIFNINGVFSQKTTDDSGNAKLNIDLMAGKYIITSSYKGCNIANTIIITA